MPNDDDVYYIEEDNWTKKLKIKPTFKEYNDFN